MNDKPWENEPDELTWTDEHTGLLCAIRRGPMKALCGYVAVDSSHPLYNLDYSNEAVPSIEVHGGLTYSGPVWPWETLHPDLHCFGFDCAHCGDRIPLTEELLGHKSYSAWGPNVYRNFAYVQSECRSLAAQLHNLALA